MHTTLRNPLKRTQIINEDNRISIINYKKYLRGFSCRRALLCYVVEPIAADLRGEVVNRFSNGGIALSWARVLNELGYQVDIIEWDNTIFEPHHQYDLVVFHGGKNFEKIYPLLMGKPRIIHFLTGSYWRFNNAREDKRRSDFKRRHGITVARDRYIYASEDRVNSTADAIIVLGDSSMKDTYSKYSKVLTIDNASFDDPHFNTVEKDYGIAKGNFLFFAGAGNIHKGLDLAIEAFAGLNENLYIMTVLDREVLEVYEEELRLPNIHLIGEVPMRTEKFYRIIDKCAYVILPSCSEGQAGSVVECMNQGLIPIVSKETRLDARNYGVVLNKTSIETIRETVQELMLQTSAQVARRAKLTRQVAISQHSPEVFRKSLKNHLQNILSGVN
jgi:glycosyltransferase involved in cell wall biosynthesis